MDEYRIVIVSHIVTDYQHESSIMNPIKRIRLQLAEKLWDADGDFKAHIAPWVIACVLLAALIVGGYGDHYYLTHAL